jgi:hypothetical protein
MKDVIYKVSTKKVEIEGEPSPHLPEHFHKTNFCLTFSNDWSAVALSVVRWRGLLGLTLLVLFQGLCISFLQDYH